MPASAVPGSGNDDVGVGTVRGAIELGCTCHSIAHNSATDEREPAGMLLVPDSNCPLHGPGPLSHHKPIA
jgi:hypothetical protein